MTKESRARAIARDAVTAAVVYRHARADHTRLEIGVTGRYPDVTTGFAALIDLGIVYKEPRDGWGITSFGSDARRGDDVDAADITTRPAAEVSSR